MKFLPQFFPKYWTEEYQVFEIAFTDEVSIGFVTREAGGYSYLLKDDFESLKIDGFELLVISIKNLEREFEDCEIKAYKLNSGYLVFWNSQNDNFTSVRILSKKYQSVLEKIFNGDFNFSIPDRDQITCWKSDDQNDNDKFARETIEDFNQSEYRLSGKVYSYNDIPMRR